MTGNEFLQMMARGPLAARMHPLLAGFLKDYLAHEKVIRFSDRYVINTHFPPYPSRAFENVIGHFTQVGDAQARRLFSVTLAVTNRCNYRCWHCYCFCISFWEQLNSYPFSCLLTSFSTSTR